MPSARPAAILTVVTQTGERRYELVLRGELSDRFVSAFAGVELTRVEGNTVLRCTVDQEGLHVLLGRVQELGLCLLSVRLA
jgi:hypothetical protein